MEKELNETTQLYYKLIVTEHLENIIRYFCSRFPNTEYSGVLFYDVEGSFEQNNLCIIAKDFCCLDIGDTVTTEFENNPLLASYMVENDLIMCQQGLLHSHHTMQTNFSGTDMNTLEQEGKLRNHFVSLIVNNIGKYTAKITRKIISESLYYNTFSDKKCPITGVSIEKVEIFPLGVEIERSININRITEFLEDIQNRKTQKSLIESIEPTYIQKDLFDQSIQNIYNTPFNTQKSLPDKTVEQLSRDLFNTILTGDINTKNSTQLIKDTNTWLNFIISNFNLNIEYIDCNEEFNCYLNTIISYFEELIILKFGHIAENVEVDFIIPTYENTVKHFQNIDIKTTSEIQQLLIETIVTALNRYGKL